MYVIAGSVKGRKLKSLPGLSTRPILARIKKSLFDIIRLEISGALFLDLFAGTGSVGIEALSRGARHCVFVEKDSQAAAVIKENLLLTGLSAKGQVLVGNVFDIIRNLGQDYDIIFVGPPYKMQLVADTVAALEKQRVLKEDGLIIAQHHFKEEVPLDVGMVRLIRQEKYGDTRLSFYRETL